MGLQMCQNCGWKNNGARVDCWVLEQNCNSIFYVILILVFSQFSSHPGKSCITLTAARWGWKCEKFEKRYFVEKR